MSVSEEEHVTTEEDGSDEDASAESRMQIGAVGLSDCKQTQVGSRSIHYGKIKVERVQRFIRPSPCPPEAVDSATMRLQAAVENQAHGPGETGSGHNSMLAEEVDSEDPTQPLLAQAIIRRAYKHGLCAGAGVVLAMVTIALIIAAIIKYYQLVPSPSDDDNLPTNFTARLVTRGEWFALPPKHDLTPFQFCPQPFVIVSHTAGQQCTDRQSCRVLMRNIQVDQMRGIFDDISYNFLVGGDGYIYEGRGWSNRGAVVLSMNCATLSVGFIGYFVVQPPPKKQIDALKLILDHALGNRTLTADYKMFMHKQVVNTESPGEALIQILMQWPHWKPFHEQDKLCKQS